MESVSPPSSKKRKQAPRRVNAVLQMLDNDARLKRIEVEKRRVEKRARLRTVVSANTETAACGGSSAATAVSPSPSQPAIVAAPSAPPIPSCKKTTTTDAENTTTADAAVVVASSSIVGGARGVIPCNARHLAVLRSS